MSERQMGKNLAEIKLDHTLRYMLASQLLGPDEKVIDAACGCGYGTHMLSRKAKLVWGMDICPETIKFAKEHYPAANAEFHVIDVLKLPTHVQYKCDTVVSFETIEHVQDDRQLLRNFRKIGDRLICSVPNEELVPWSKETHPWHFRHYTLHEIQKILAECGWQINRLFGAPNGKSPIEENLLGKNIILECV